MCFSNLVPFRGRYNAYLFIVANSFFCVSIRPIGDNIQTINLMRTLLFFACFCISITAAIAQSPVLDSLEYTLANHHKKDTTKVRLMIQLSNNVVWSDTDRAMELASEALELAKDIDWTRGVAYAYRQQGVILYRTSDYLEALAVNQEALRVNKLLNDKALEASIYNNMANTHSDLGQFDKALEYYNILLSLSRESKNKEGEIIALVNRALVYNDLDRQENALEDLKQALTISREIGHLYFQSAILNNIGRGYEHIKDNEQAAQYYEEAITLAKTTGNKTTVASSMNRLANIYLQDNDYTKARDYALEALQAGRELNALESQSAAWKTLSFVYDSLNNQAKALDAFKNHISLRDSILNEDNKSEIVKKEMQFKMEMQEALDTAEIDKQTTLKNLAIIGIILISIGAIITYIFYKRRRDAIEAKKEADFKLVKAETELKVLRSQMNPHFIFNSLNSISDYIDKHDIDTANDYLIKFSRLMRWTLENSEKEAISLSEDLQWMELYLQLEALRLDHKFSYHIAIDDDIDPDNLNIPPMILQPFVENSIWHGITKKTGQGRIDIRISKNNGMLLCSVDDNGVGRQAVDLPEEAKRKSFGIKITQNRINILNEINRTEGKVLLTDKEEGVHVEVKLPVELIY